MRELDFLPASFHEARRRQQARRRNMLYSAGLAVALGCLHFIGSSQVKQAQATLASLRRGDQERTLRQSRFNALQTRKRVISSRLELLDRLDDDAPVDVVLAEITRLMTDDMALRSMKLEITRATKPAGDQEEADPVLARGPTQVSLQGMAATDMAVGIFFGRLAECDLFSNVELLFSRAVEGVGQPGREFALSFTVRPVVIGR